MIEAFPFTAIVGQQEMKHCLVLTAIDPSIGGVLVLGDRGTGKSTIVRSLASLLPKLRAEEDCPYNCSKMNNECSFCKIKNESKVIFKLTPVIDLPLGSTEDRVVGSLDIEKALKTGEKSFEPGLLARANRGYLYIDEVNLLEDHIVDLLLDVAASGENLVEREGMSIRHKSKFVLIGSGNPEEGELRPQLLDRFGLSLEVKSPVNIDERIEVIKRRDEYEKNPQKFIRKWRKEDTSLRSKILSAKKLLKAISASDEILKKCARVCLELGADGLRGELTLLRSARANAAFKGKLAVDDKDIKEVCLPALRHRLRKNPLDESGSDVRISRIVSKTLNL